MVAPRKRTQRFAGEIPRLKLIIVRPKLAGVSATALERFAVRAQKAARLRGELAILITSSVEIRKLNRDFRGKDKPTDVLSFPSDAKGIAGDIAISAQIARQQANALGHSLATELKVLMLHGMLHLAGHDHETDRGEMAKLEANLRAKLELPSGLIERTERKSAGEGARATRKPRRSA